MKCQTFSHIGLDGQRVYKPKFEFNTQDEAITAAKSLNLKDNQLTKAVAYRCAICGKYHVGRNGKLVTDKYIQKIKHNNY